MSFAIGKTQSILYIRNIHTILYYSHNSIYSIYRNILSFLNCAKTLYIGKCMNCRTILYIYNIFFFVYCANILTNCIFFLYIDLHEYHETSIKASSVHSGRVWYSRNRWYLKSKKHVKTNVYYIRGFLICT